MTDDPKTKPAFKIEPPRNRKVRPDDKRGPSTNPISTPKTSEEAKKAFREKQFKPKFQNHPLKKLILDWFESGISASKIIEKLAIKALEDNVKIEEYSLSLPTVIKLRRRHLHAIGALKKEDMTSRVTTITQRERTGAEKVLWDTIEECTKKKKDISISPKDWQYFDQQQQSAITLLQNMREEGKSGEDISLVISRVFAQFFKQHLTNGTQSVPVGTDDGAGQKKD